MNGGEVKIEGLKECRRPGCVNTVPLSRGTKPRLFCDDPECQLKRRAAASKTHRANVRDLLARRDQARASR